MKKIIKVSELQLSNISLVDNVGKTYYWQDKILKIINYDFIEQITFMFECGLINELFEKKLIPKTIISDYTIENFNGLILEQEKIDIIYPQELSHEMLKDIAKLVLFLIEVCNKHGYFIKDCHLHNIGFKDNYFLFLDIGSIQKKNSQFFVFPSYKEFLLQYYIPLKLLSKGYTNKAYNLIETLYGREISTSIICEYFKDISYTYKLFPLNILIKIYNLYFKIKNIHMIKQDRIKKHKAAYLIKLLLKPYFRCLTNVNLSNLSKIINNISFHSHKESQWSNYYNEINISKEISNRFVKIVDIISKLKDIKTLCDIGSNAGLFVFYLLQRGINMEKVWCIDYDRYAIDKLYHLNKKDYMYSIVPICNNPFIPRLIWFQEKLFKRCAADLVTCLALTHHLLLSQNFDIDHVLIILSRFTKKYLLIEFMPLGLWDGENAIPIPSWYCKEWFEIKLNEYFYIMSFHKIEENRILYVCKKNN